MISFYVTRFRTTFALFSYFPWFLIIRVSFSDWMLICCRFGVAICRSSRPEVFLWKGVLKICCKFTGEHPCRSMISVKLQSSFIEIGLRHECSHANLQHIFRASIYKNTYGGLLLHLFLLNISESDADNTDALTLVSASIRKKSFTLFFQYLRFLQLQ